MYAEIILPLPLYGTYTYEVPGEAHSVVQAGMRVMVQFGKKKVYTGIVESLHNNRPDYEVKPLLAVLDRQPVLRYPQLKLWNWISEYYLCSIGDVYKAAVPAGLKPESETFVSLNENCPLPEDGVLTEKQALVIMALDEKGKMKISDIAKELKIQNAAQTVTQLLDRGYVTVSEKVVERYRAKKETFINITLRKGDNDGLHDFFGMVKRSRQQEKALITWLELSDWHRGGEQKEVTRQNLLESSGASAAVLRSMIEKGIFIQEKKVLNRFNGSQETHAELPRLSELQASALSDIQRQFTVTQTVLLHGVTGSGKTEIYSHLIAKALKDGNQVLYLVPEISLTTQLTDRLRKIFGEAMVVYHSKFSDSERVDIWKKVLEEKGPLVVLGARSSLFLPFAHLGLVVVDEEHESSYKQFDPAPRYNARDTAMVLAAMHGAKVLLGSATPSVETYHKALNGKFGLTELTERFSGSVLPDVEIVDMRDQRKRKLNSGILSSSLRQEMQRNLAAHKQSIIFQNRRGYAPVVVCRQCGWTPKCENCDVSMVYHKNTNLLKCHYCGYTRPLPALCPACGQNSVDTFGYGTERIAEDVARAFPEAKVSRMDLDTTRNKDSYQELIEEFGRHETDILVGTQMVSKGLDFQDVHLAAVVNADTLLNFPDFRSNERAFNMLEQVAGRAGRRLEKGKVVIQTTDPANPVLKYVENHDFKGYFNHEIKEREKFRYPPFTKIINIYLRNKDSAAVDAAAVLFTKKLREVFGDRVLGPEKPFVSRVALWHIQSIMLKIEAGASMRKVKDLLRAIYTQCAPYPPMKTTQIHYDVDPN